MSSIFWRRVYSLAIPRGPSYAGPSRCLYCLTRRVRPLTPLDTAVAWPTRPSLQPRLQDVSRDFSEDFPYDPWRSMKIHEDPYFFRLGFSINQQHPILTIFWPRTNRILEAEVDKDSEDAPQLDAELSMLPVWNFSLQDRCLGSMGTPRLWLSNHVKSTIFVWIQFWMFWIHVQSHQIPCFYSIIEGHASC